MKRNQKLLIIDDDRNLVEGLKLYLERQGYEVIVAIDGITGLQLFQEEAPDLVVLDIMMPKMDGWEVCKRMRDMATTPIIMLTARSREVDRIVGLKMGADDYVTKPFNVRELEARIEAVLRRTTQAAPSRSPIVFTDERLVIDTGSQEVTVNGERMELTPTERRLLMYLVQNVGKILTTEQILSDVWGSQYVDAVESVKFYVWRLRQKIEPDPKNPRYIRTEWGTGYRFAQSSNEDASEGKS